MNIETNHNPIKEDLAILSAGIKSHNQQHIPDEVVFEPDTKFAVFARNDDGKVVGGIRACAYWNYCIIELLWLSKEARGHGVGTKLIEATEKAALEKGFEYVRTETTSFQALPFYKKQGYTVLGELPNYPKGHTTYCLYKELK